MNADLKKKINKVLIVVSVALAGILTVLGVYFIVHASSQGEERVLQEHSETEQDIRASVSSLADDDFEYGYSNVMPKDRTDAATRQLWINELREQIENAVSTDVTLEYGSYFGDPIAFLEISTTDILDALYPVLQSNMYFKKIHIAVKDTELGLSAVYVYADGTLTPQYSLSTAEGFSLPEQFVPMQTAVIDEYGLSADNFSMRGDVLQISVGNMRLADVLDLFDYCWQYCYLAGANTHLAIVGSSGIYAFADTSANEFYDKYYPANDLAALYRVQFYLDSGFFTGDFRDACKAYI